MEDLLTERGLDVSYETVRRWVLKFGATIADHAKAAKVKNIYAELGSLARMMRTDPGAQCKAICLTVQHAPINDTNRDTMGTRDTVL